jgi:hypothetical protein
MKISSIFSALLCATSALLLVSPDAYANTAVKGKNGKCEVTVKNKKYVLSGCASVVKTTNTEAVGFCYPRFNYICSWKLK